MAAADDEDGRPLLVASKVTKAFEGLVANRDIDFDIPRHSIVSIIGPNGAGKTTFFNQLTGIYAPTSGSITFGDVEHLRHGAARRGRARHRADVPEHPPLPEHDRPGERDGRSTRPHAMRSGTTRSCGW